MPQPAPTLILACGALAREILALTRANGLAHVKLQCLPAQLHNQPQLIPQAVRDAIRRHRPDYARILVAYGDCGTGGELDRVLAEEGVRRIEGAHCYAFFTGFDRFEQLAEEEVGTFWLTDFLARQFDTLVWQGLGLDRHPDLLPLYFGNYRRIVYLAQTDDPVCLERAQAAAVRLGLEFRHVPVGFGVLDDFVKAAAGGEDDGRSHRGVLAGHPRPGDRQAGPQDRQAGAAGPFLGGDRPGGDAGEAHRYRRLSGAVAPGRTGRLRRRSGGGSAARA
ncbi:MAG TPA: DUF1638 domain-containing protein [Geminicoccus sp.]|nr:DUF1638 domain-containing protein [Geminicoccus sp.]HWL67569.1 DUF1638 domain-containing protein [Geminicoccus sp.]